MKFTTQTVQQESKTSFFTALFKGLMYVVGAIAGCLGILQTLYGLGWCLYSVMPKNGPHTASILGIERSFAADPSAPATAWMFATDSQPILFSAGLVLLIALAMTAFVMVIIAEMGGWRNPRMEAFREWMNK